MNEKLLTGKLTRLVAFDPERAGDLHAKWYADSEFAGYYDFRPVRPRNAARAQAWLRERNSQDDPNLAQFLIQTLSEAQIIGECELEINFPPHREAFVAIAIGERAFWSKGYGTDALRVLLRFGFDEWNLHRVSLALFGQNTRALRSYEKAGFRIEGRRRALWNRGGARHDDIVMGILRDEWECQSREA